MGLENSMNLEILRAVDLLKQGDIIVAPTDTVYGLFGDATNDKAIQKIYQIKGRPLFNPLIVHVSGLDMAKQIASFSKESESIAKYFWEQVKQPLTIVLRLHNDQISKYVTAGLSAVALRCPAHPIALDLIKKFNGPLAAPSANTSNRLSPTSAEMVKNDLGNKVSLILNGGRCNIGIESTIIDLTKQPYVILRPGGVSIDDISNLLNTSIDIYNNCNTILSPGMMKKHYSPRLPLRINVTEPHQGEAFIAFGPSSKKYDINLSNAGDLREAAKNLFQTLNIVDDESKYNGIAVMPIPNVGLGISINDRLQRAAYK